MPTIFTSKAELSPLSIADAASLFVLRTDPEVNRYLDRPIQHSLEETIEFIEKIRQGREEKKWFYWAIRDAKGELIGTICLYNLSADRKVAEIGYELLPAYQKKGIMQAAIEAVIDFAFRNGIEKLEAITHKDNTASASLLLRNGFKLEEDRKDPVEKDLLIYTLEASSNH